MALLSVFFIGLIIGLPVALVMGLATLAAFIADGAIPLEVFPQRVFSGLNSFPLMTVPFFILAADLMTGGKLTDRLIDFSNNLVGHITGGLGHVNILVSTFFAGISGSALADASGPGSVIMSVMRKSGYEKNYSGALTAASAVIGNIIPPSILMIIYSLNDTNITVIGLFLAGVVPGLLLALALMVANQIISNKRNYLFKSEGFSFKRLYKSFLKAFSALMMPIILLGGILSGVFTATEASAVAVAYALIIGIFVTKALTIKNLPRIFAKSSIVTASVLLIVAMGAAFSWTLTYAQVPQNLAQFLTGITENTLGILFLIALFALITGMFVDTLPAVIILVPVLSPVALQVGADPTQVAIIIIMSLSVGMLTPPVAPLLFVVSMVGRLKLESLFLAVIPLFLAELFIIVLVILIPEISTWLPNLLGGG